MSLISMTLILLLLLIQYPLWFGKGGWLRVFKLKQQLIMTQQQNDALKVRNTKLESEVLNLKEGGDSLEERARMELGMIKKNETFVQFLD